MHIQEKDEMDLRPVFTEDGITYIYIKVCEDANDTMTEKIVSND